MIKTLRLAALIYSKFFGTRWVFPQKVYKMVTENVAEECEQKRNDITQNTVINNIQDYFNNLYCVYIYV